MKNEILIYTIGNIADQYIAEAQPADMKPGKSRVLVRRPVVIAAVIATFLLLCAFTVYVVSGGDLWNQQPSYDPVKTVRTAIENQIGKDYTISIEVESIKIDEEETAFVLDRFIKGEIAKRRGWSDEYLAEHFIVVKAVYRAEYDRTKTTRSDGHIIQYFYLTQDIKSGKWKIVDNSGNVNWSGETKPDEINEMDSISVPGFQDQIVSYLSKLFTEAYAPYYDGLHYKITNYEETIQDRQFEATFQWTMVFLGKGWDVAGDEGVETEGNFSLKAEGVINDHGEIDLDTLSILADNSAVGPPDYCVPVEEFFPDQLSR